MIYLLLSPYLELIVSFNVILLVSPESMDLSPSIRMTDSLLSDL